MDVTTKVCLHSLSLRELRAYVCAAVLVAANIVVPQAVHLFIDNGGSVLLPIYFFTLVGAYKYGWQVGLFTAVASPLLSALLTGMPSAAVMPVMLIKSSAIALCAAFVARKARRVSLPSVGAAVVLSQALGSLVVLAVVQDAATAFSDVVVGWPGLLVELFAGYAVLRFVFPKA